MTREVSNGAIGCTRDDSAVDPACACSGEQAHQIGPWRWAGTGPIRGERKARLLRHDRWFSWFLAYAASDWLQWKFLDSLASIGALASSMSSHGSMPADNCASASGLGM